MDVTCEVCGRQQQLAESNADRDNWEVVVEHGQPVARRLAWKCLGRAESTNVDGTHSGPDEGCDATNVILEPLNES
jgi:hypothetical protein